MPSLVKECPDCGATVHVRKLVCPCGHVLRKSRRLTFRGASKQTLEAEEQHKKANAALKTRK